MTQRNDTVFHLSLSEIAFTICFLLLLLLGWLVFRVQAEKAALAETLKNIQSTERSASAALDAIGNVMTDGVGNSAKPTPEEIITRLVAAENVHKERDCFLQRIKGLESRLTALGKMQERIQAVARTSRPDTALERIADAMALQTLAETTIRRQNAGPVLQKDLIRQVENALVAGCELKKQLETRLNTPLKPGREPDIIRNMVAAMERFDGLSENNAGIDLVKRENADLRGRIAYMKRRMEDRGGLDYPPCWADEKTGKVEFLFNVEVKPDQVVVLPAWPEHREIEARALPGIEGILSDPPLSNADFIRRVQGIFDQSRELQCRHFVRLKSTIDDAVQSDRARLMVESFFYKSEVRR